MSPALSATDFDFIRDLLGNSSALVLDESKHYLVESRLQPVARVHGYSGISELILELKKPSSKVLKDEVIDAMTTNETSFFRDFHPFQTLKKDLLPELVEKRSRRKALRIWCAACSSGQEPYSIAMIIRDHFPQLSSWDVQILCTDISDTMIKRAREGKFNQIEVNRGLPAPMLIKYFSQSGTVWEIKPELRAMLRFRKVNLAEPFLGFETQDLVFIRNVLIYFSVDTKRNILGKTKKILAPDGSLLLGSTESTINVDDSFDRVVFGKTTVFRLPAK